MIHTNIAAITTNLIDACFCLWFLSGAFAAIFICGPAILYFHSGNQPVCGMVLTIEIYCCLLLVLFIYVVLLFNEKRVSDINKTITDKK